MKAGSIIEIQYPEWLANPVVVKKKNGKWRVCVDFTDLNKACPKDSFPLPHIDRLVEATAGNELLSFMDAFSGYNQIKMNPSDRAKTAFITERGTYCYKVMPFGLKNAGATYQRLVNKMFADQLGKTMEVYIDDMLVKSTHAADHVTHLETCFASLNAYNMKLNPTKCTFAVASGEFLGHIVTKRGIEANPKQITAILNLPSPKNVREVQRLTGRIAALNRFISRSTDRCLPFYQLLKGNKRFAWDEQCEEAFTKLKQYLTTPPILAKPEPGDTLLLYVAVSNAAVSGVLVRENQGEQLPVNYVSKSLIEPETRYSWTEKLALAVVTSARKLRPYFQSHSIVILSDQPLRTALHSPNQSGRMTRWAIELSEYDIDFRTKTSAKSQVLAEFLAELPPNCEPQLPEVKAAWHLYVDGSSCRAGSGVGIRLIAPDGEILEQSFRLNFPASNNEAEYEALLAGLRLAKNMEATDITAYCDSQLVACQYNGDFSTRNERMEAYLLAVQNAARNFNTFTLTKIPRSDNSSADALAALASTSDPAIRRVIPVESIDAPSVPTDTAPSVFAINTSDSAIRAREFLSEPMDTDPPPRTWIDDIRSYLDSGDLPLDKWEARRIKARSAYYTLYHEHLFRRSATGTLMKCVEPSAVTDVMREMHEGAGGNHGNGRTLALKLKRHGLFWPTMINDCEAFVKRCEACQRHAPAIHAPTEPLTPSVAPYPFMRWAMDIIGPFPPCRQKRFVLVMTDYFTKWVEAEAYAQIHVAEVRKFVWKFIICRHGLPYEIITDNGSQFIAPAFEDFCARWKIRLNKSTPRYPQGNGQAEATNKTIIDGLRRRLDSHKGSWADELDGVLWSHRTTPRRATNQSPFSLSHGVEAMSPAEVGVGGPRQIFLVSNPELNDQLLLEGLDEVEEKRSRALARVDNYQRCVAKLYNAGVRRRYFMEGDLVLRRVYENTKEENAGKLGANWEGPYIISKTVKPGVYELITEEGEPIPRSWNATKLKKYFP